VWEMNSNVSGHIFYKYNDELNFLVPLKEFLGPLNEYQHLMTEMSNEVK
jgi:hypothetical protein